MEGDWTGVWPLTPSASVSAQSGEMDLALDMEVLRQRIENLKERVRRRGEQEHSSMMTMGQEERDRRTLKQFDQIWSEKPISMIEVQSSSWEQFETPGSLEENINSLLDCVEGLLNRLIYEELEVWKRLRPWRKTLNDLQSLSECFLKLIQGLQRVLNNMQGNLAIEGPFLYPNLHNFQERLKQLFQRILGAALLPEVGPPQVLKVSTKFPQHLKLNWLVGSKLLSPEWGGKFLLQPMRVWIISEAQARDVSHNPDLLLNDDFKGSGQLTRDTANLEVIDNKCYFHFRNLQLKRIDREIKKVKGGFSSPSPPKPQLTPHQKVLQQSAGNSPPVVTDEKFCLLYHAQLEVGQQRIHVLSFSQPIVVISHGTQEAQAWGTVEWDNAFSDFQRVSFQVCGHVPWSKLKNLLSLKWAESTGKGLDDKQLEVLKRKLVPVQDDGQSGDDPLITFSRFAKEVGGGFPFWEWFYSALRVVEKHALRPWRDGGILGFIPRPEAEALLKGRESGTFLLRFSDTVLGGISITYVDKCGIVRSLSPFTTRNLTFRSLTNTLHDLDNLIILYPNFPKGSIFPNTSAVEVEGVATPLEGTSINYSILKGMYGQQDALSLMGVGSPPRMRAGKLRGPSGSSGTSDYVESYPRISIPQQFI